MKKLFLLSTLALASMGANAQTFEIEDVTIEAGKSGFITLSLGDIEYEEDEVQNFRASVLVPAGVTPGDAADINFGGLLTEDMKSHFDIKYQVWASNDITLMITGKDETYFIPVGSDITIKLPVNVASTVANGEYKFDPADLECDSEIQFGNTYIAADDDYTFGALTVGEGVAPLTYAAKIYEAAGVTVNMNVADAASLQSYLSSHKNAIAVFASAVPDEIAALDNVVVDGVAKSIVLTSQNEYPYTGEAFVAEKVSFEYWIGTKATKAGGWNSLAIPFTGTPEVEPFTTADMNSGKYWAKVYTGSNSEGLLFGNLASAQFEANKSYLVAFPGSDYGVNEFTSVTLNITAENEKVYPAANNKSGGAPYSMTTVYAGYTPASSYVLNDAGTKFEYKDAMQIAAPFTAFASAELGAPVLRSLAILDANQGITSAADAAVASTTVYGEDGEIVIIASEAGVASIVNMNGQVVKTVAYNEGETRVAIAAGAYVVAGQVVIVK